MSPPSMPAEAVFSPFAPFPESGLRICPIRSTKKLHSKYLAVQTDVDISEPTVHCRNILRENVK